MKLLFLSVGKAHEPYVKAGVDDFTKRINNYFRAEWLIVPVPKGIASLPESQAKEKEGAAILDQLLDDDFVIALEERGKQLTSEGLAQLLQARANESTRRVVFVIGGAFGLDQAVLNRARYQWSLSQLVFPHQLVRLILAEQVYRACTIQRNEKYHHK